jgi:NAD(P)-dependent dehydrogenase (short-subunit alcohol dehydrogenase family)
MYNPITAVVWGKSMQKPLSGRVAIVTGAGTGIGQGIALAMAKAGADILVVGRTRETLNTTSSLIEAAGSRTRIVQGSIAERETAIRAVDEAVATFGRLDILVNNAHTFTDYFGLEDTPEENFRTHLESGFFGSLHFMQAAFPQLREKRGSVINIGSVAGVEGWATLAPYNVAKEAIRALSRTASRDWGKYGIRVNIILPAAHSKIADEILSDPQVMQAMLARIPLGYIGEAELDIGGVAVFLASDAARYVTGQTLRADGGM